jgi:hypothetical protein
MEVRSREGETHSMFSAAIQPGLDTTFPWGHNIATAFEKYKVHSMGLSYVPSVSTATAGAVTLAVDFDAADDNSDLTKGQLMSFEGAVRAPVWTPFEMDIRTADLRDRGQLYIRDGALGDNLDVKTYDLGRFWVSVDGFNTIDYVYGELFITYDVEFFIPNTHVDKGEIVLAATTKAATLTFTENLVDYYTDPFQTGEAEIAYAEDIGIEIEPGVLIPSEGFDCTVIKLKRPGQYLINTNAFGTTGAMGCGTWDSFGSSSFTGDTIEKINATRSDAFASAATSNQTLVTVGNRHSDESPLKIFLNHIYVDVGKQLLWAGLDVALATVSSLLTSTVLPAKARSLLLTREECKPPTVKPIDDGPVCTAVRGCSSRPQRLTPSGQVIPLDLPDLIAAVVQPAPTHVPGCRCISCSSAPGGLGNVLPNSE